MYSRTPVERPPSPMTTPLIRPHFEWRTGLSFCIRIPHERPSLLYDHTNVYSEGGRIRGVILYSHIRMPKTKPTVDDLCSLCGIAPPPISDGQSHPSLINTNKKTIFCIISRCKVHPVRNSNQDTASFTLLNALMAAPALVD